MVLTENEEKFLKRYFNEYAIHRGEDVIGVLMLNGAFKELPDGQLVEFSNKLEDKRVEIELREQIEKQKQRYNKNEN